MLDTTTVVRTDEVCCVVHPQPIRRGTQWDEVYQDDLTMMYMAKGVVGVVEMQSCQAACLPVLVAILQTLEDIQDCVLLVVQHVFDRTTPQRRLSVMQLGKDKKETIKNK